MEESTITPKDVETAIKIFHRAIDAFKIPDEQTDEQAKEFIKEDGSIDFENIPFRTIKTWDNGTKFLNLTYFYDGFLTVYADYNPVVAILDFIDSARKHFKAIFPQANVDDIEKWTEVEAIKMTFALISRIYQRMDLAMRNYTDEVIHNWFIEWRRWEKEANKELRFIKNYQIEKCWTKFFKATSNGMQRRHVKPFGFVYTVRENPVIRLIWQMLPDSVV